MKGDTVETKIDNLANAVGQGFKDVAVRLDNLEGRVNVIDQKIDALRTEMVAMHFDYRKILYRIEKLEARTFGAIQE